MRALTADDLRDLREVRRSLLRGYTLTQADVDALVSEWSVRADPDAKDSSESFASARPDGSLTGATGPRWLFHLFGIAHRTAHVGFATGTGLIVLQRRASTKVDWPDAWDMAVAGHVPLDGNGVSLSFEEGAWKEIEEEVGLPRVAAPDALEGGQLTSIGDPYVSFDRDEDRNPPFYNAECRQLYGAILTPVGLSRLMPDGEEVSGIYLCTPEEAWNILERGPIASGLRYSLPRFLDWLTRR